jgi:undecaprenyl-diphosphatase
MLARPRPAVLLLVVAGLLAVLGLGLLIANGGTFGFDGAVIDLLRDPAAMAGLSFLRPVTELGSTTTIAIVALILFVAELAAGHGWLGAAGALTIGTTAAVNSGLKSVVDRARPDLLPPIVIETGYSYPSGHSASSMVTYGIIALLLVRHDGLPRWLRFVGALVCGVIVGLVGLSRIYLGVHFPSDVLGGWLLGAMVVLLFAELTRAPRSPGRPGRSGAVSPASRERDAEAAGADPAGRRSDPPAAG